MDGKNYKPVNRLIESEIRKRFVSQWQTGGGSTHFVVLVEDLKEVDCDIENPRVEVCSTGAVNDVAVDAQMNLGPSDEKRRMKVDSIYTEGRAIPPSVGSVTLKGVEVVNGRAGGRKVSRTYSAAAK